jgi:hypothetical protein
MSAMSRTAEVTRAPSASPLVGWLLLAGGVLYFVGGSMHPKEDPPGVSLKQHLLVMYEDPAWYPAHAVFFVGMVLLAAALVTLVRGGSLRPVRHAHALAVVAAVTSTLAAAGSLLHLVSGSDAHRIAAGHSTPITDVQVIVETVTVPAFGASIAALAVVGAMTGTIGNWVAAVLGVIGGVAYALAGGTFLLTDRLNFLFPVSSAIALWALVAGIGLLLRGRAARRAVTQP